MEFAFAARFDPFELDQGFPFPFQKTAEDPPEETVPEPALLREVAEGRAAGGAVGLEHHAGR